MPDAAGQSIELYKQGEALPGGPEKARGIAVHGGYGSIEGLFEPLPRHRRERLRFCDRWMRKEEKTSAARSSDRAALVY